MIFVKKKKTLSFYVLKGHLESNADRTASTSQSIINPFRTTSTHNPPSHQNVVPQDDLDTDNTLNVDIDNGQEDNNNGSNISRNTRNSRRHDDGNIDFDFD